MKKKTEIENEKLTSFTTNGGTFSSWARNFLEPTLRVSATLFTTYSDAILRFSSLYCGQHTPSRGLKKVEGGTILRRDKSVLCGVHATTHAILLQTRFATGEEKGWRKMSNFWRIIVSATKWRDDDDHMDHIFGRRRELSGRKDERPVRRIRKSHYPILCRPVCWALELRDIVVITILLDTVWSNRWQWKVVFFEKGGLLVHSVERAFEGFSLFSLWCCFLTTTWLVAQEILWNTRFINYVENITNQHERSTNKFCQFKKFSSTFEKFSIKYVWGYKGVDRKMRTQVDFSRFYMWM